jgi:hypothetical protein
MTDAEVAAMTREGESGLARRMAKHSPTMPIGKLTSKEAAPPRITAAEKDQIQRTGRVPQRVRERLAKAAESDVSPDPTTTGKDAPKVDPERRRRG